MNSLCTLSSQEYSSNEYLAARKRQMRNRTQRGTMVKNTSPQLLLAASRNSCWRAVSLKISVCRYSSDAHAVWAADLLRCLEIFASATVSLQCFSADYREHSECRKVPTGTNNEALAWFLFVQTTERRPIRNLCEAPTDRQMVALSTSLFTRKVGHI